MLLLAGNKQSRGVIVVRKMLASVSKAAVSSVH